MSSSFWKQSPGPHWSDYMKSLWTPVQHPSLFQASFPKPSFGKYEILDISNTTEIIQLYTHNYSMFPKSRVCLTEELLETFLLHNGTIIIGIRQGVLLVGCIFLRHLGSLLSGSNTLSSEPQAVLIDFFCVHRDHRKLGIGTKLLQATVYEGSQRGIQVYLFMKEGLPHLHCPPLRTSTYIWRPRTKPPPVNLNRFLRKSTQLPKGAELWNSPRFSHHATVYECNAFKLPVYVAVTDMFHRSDAGGMSMGEIVWIWYDTSKGSLEEQQLQRVIETVVDSCSFDLLFMDVSLPHDKSLWTTDVTYSWYAFNFHPKRFFFTSLALTY